MTPAARVQASIEVLETWSAGSEGLDRVLTSWARNHRFAGSGDRRAIADLVYDSARRLRSSAWVAGADEHQMRGVVRGSLLLDHRPVEDLFDGSRYGPGVLLATERAAGNLSEAPRPVRLDYPDWLDADLVSVPDAALAALRVRAPVDLRANTLKTTRQQASEMLRADGVETEPVPKITSALRVTEGARRVATSQAYKEGAVEIQDAASQAAAAFAGAKPGMTVLDLCAGGGGKTLAIGAFLGGRGRLLAYDISANRMKDLPQRAARAGLSVDVLAESCLKDLQGKCDLVVVDAPCSGTGTWRRNPDYKWRLTRQDLLDLERTQAALLEQAGRFVGPNGRVVYMTCSILERENRAQVSRFTVDTSGWRIAEEMVLSPADGTDGFYAAALARRSR